MKSSIMIAPTPPSKFKVPHKQCCCPLLPHHKDATSVLPPFPRPEIQKRDFLETSYLHHSIFSSSDNSFHGNYSWICPMYSNHSFRPLEYHFVIRNYGHYEVAMWREICTECSSFIETPHVMFHWILWFGALLEMTILLKFFSHRSSHCI